MKTLGKLTLALALAAAALPAQDHWVATWATAQNLFRGPAPANANPNATAPRGYHDQTIRMIVRTSLAGRKLRVRLSNQFGGTPLKVGAAHIALRSKAAAIVEGSDH